jgi:dTDP-4-dehydrorhamnose reductase
VVTHGCAQQAEVQLDLTDPLQTISQLKRINPDVVINLVAATNVDHCEEDPSFARTINVTVVANIVRALHELPGCHLIHLSTDQVYDGPGFKTEEHVTLRNCYAVTKHESEQVALQVGASVIRTNFFGKSLSPRRTSFTDWVYSSLSEKKQISLFTDVFFSPLSFASLSRAMELVILKKAPGVFNLGSRNGMSKEEFARHFAMEAGLALDTVEPRKIDELKLRAPRPKDMRMNSGLFERTFQYRCPLLEEEIRTVAAAYLGLRRSS